MPIYFGKSLIVDVVHKRLGYTNKVATKIVNQVVAILIKAIKQGKNIQLEGIGTLQIIDRKHLQKRKMTSNLVIGPTVVTNYRYAKTIRLKPDPKFRKTGV